VKGAVLPLIGQRLLKKPFTAVALCGCGKPKLAREAVVQALITPAANFALAFAMLAATPDFTPIEHSLGLVMHSESAPQNAVDGCCDPGLHLWVPKLQLLVGVQTPFVHVLLGQPALLVQAWPMLGPATQVPGQAAWVVHAFPLLVPPTHEDG
jgi:hypothetical protein